jgi:hypothetical protein
MVVVWHNAIVTCRAMVCFGRPSVPWRAAFRRVSTCDTFPFSIVKLAMLHDWAWFVLNLLVWVKWKVFFIDFLRSVFDPDVCWINYARVSYCCDETKYQRYDHRDDSQVLDWCINKAISCQFTKFWIFKCLVSDIISLVDVFQFEKRNHY